MVRIAEAAVVAMLAATAVAIAAAEAFPGAVVVEVLEEAVAGAKGDRGDSLAQATSLMRGSRRLDMGRCHASSVTLRDCGARAFIVYSEVRELFTSHENTD